MHSLTLYVGQLLIADALQQNVPLPGVDWRSIERYTPHVMKKDFHPKNYRPVVFKDLNDGATFITRSTVATSESIRIDGQDYPLVNVHISSSSHPFYTGQERLVDVEGRVDRFKARQKAAADKKAARSNKARKAQKKTQTQGDAPSTQKIGGGKQGKTATKKQQKKLKPSVKQDSKSKAA